jgi:peptidoglycan/xylan/chitin deacetylase (PgdA/CDA1 family)
VCLSFDFDATSLWFMFGSTGARSLSRGEFGVTDGAPRLLELLRKYGIVSTWFVPGHTADNYPDVVRAIAADGHEIGNHGYLHEDLTGKTPKEAAGIVERGSDALERVTGTRPVGCRMPAGDFDAGVFPLLVEQGFTYDSSLIGGYRPRWARDADEVDSDRRITPGADVDLVELPVSFMISDFVHFEINFMPPFPAAAPNPRDVQQIWTDEFDYIHERVPGGYMMPMMHPQCIGWGNRILMLERFIEHCAAHDSVSFTTSREIADSYRMAVARGAAGGAAGD